MPVLGGVTWWGGSSGLHSLPLAAHVTSLRLLRLGEVLVYIPDVHQRPGEKMAFPDGLEPSGFGVETSRAVQVADGGLLAGKLVDVVDGVARRGAVSHGVNVMTHRADRRDAIERIEGVLSFRAV